jgi:hypothetical protein
MKGLVTPSLQFNHVSTMCSTIPTYKLEFLFVFDDSLVRTKDSSEDPKDTSEDTEDPDPSISYTTSIPTLFYQMIKAHSMLQTEF